MTDDNKTPPASAEGKVIQFPNGTGREVTLPADLIINALKCVDAAAQRGSYQGGELSQVGGVRDALYASVEDVIKEMAEKMKKQKPQG